MTDGSDDEEQPTLKRPRKTGYRSPPPEHQFQPGTSGNPRGRPRGAKGFRSELLRELNEHVAVTSGGKRKKLNRLRYLIKTTIHQGMEANDLRTKIQLLQAIAQFMGLEDVGGKPEEALGVEDQRLLDAYLNRNAAPPEEAADPPADEGRDGSENDAPDGEPAEEE